MHKLDLGDIASTSLVTLYCRAIESQKVDPIINDPKAVEIKNRLDRIFSISDDRLERSLAEGRINKNLSVHIAIRAKRYDEYAEEFLKRAPDGVIVNIGCGLDSRFLRIDNGKTIFYDLDLPEVIKIKGQFFQETERYRFIASSVLDFEWMEAVSRHKGPFMFIAEGVFMYLKEEDVRSLVLRLQSVFPGSELVCEVFNSLWLKKPLDTLVKSKIQRGSHLRSGAMFNSGVRNSREIEGWSKGIELLDEWSYFDSNNKKLGWYKLYGKFELFRKMQWTVHYRLN
jgi:methyltransferase (TIGR00027 family)